MARTTTIALDDGEKEQLNTAKRAMFGTEEVPYGVVISTLIDDHPRVSEADTQTAVGDDGTVEIKRTNVESDNNAN